MSDMLDDLDAEDLPPSPRLVESEWESRGHYRLRVEEAGGRDVAIKLHGPGHLQAHTTIVMVGTPTDGAADQVLIHVALTSEEAEQLGDALKHLAGMRRVKS